MMIVVDAATDLTKTHLTDEPSDGCWFSKNITSLLSEQLRDTSLSILDALERVSFELKNKLDALGYANIPEAYPSASIMITRIIQDSIELFSIGDCTALIEYKNDEGVILIHDEAVTTLDNTVIQRLLTLQQQSGKSIAALIPQVTDMLLNNRQKRNTKEGYWIFDPTGTAIQHGTSFIFKCSDIQSLAIMSDGFYHIASLENYANPNDILTALKNSPADTLIEVLYNELSYDAEFNRFPRFKIRDDSSIIFAKVKE